MSFAGMCKVSVQALQSLSLSLEATAASGDWNYSNYVLQACIQACSLVGISETDLETCNERQH